MDQINEKGQEVYDIRNKALNEVSGDLALCLGSMTDSNEAA